MKKKILSGVCLLFGLLFINAGLNKFFNYMPAPADVPEPTTKMFMALVSISWLMPLIAVAEIAGGILYIIPQFRPLGIIIITPVLMGIVLTHITVAPDGLPMAFILLVVHILVIVENRKRFLSMIST
jgi:uncharacterized membrane protein YphA (DoxX/SURF4 family)